MKNIVKISFGLIYSSFMIYSLCCSENNQIANSEKDIVFSAYQIPGCQDQYTLTKKSEDSTFSYSFNDTLKVEFRVSGNCCPDSNRFIATNSIKNDTIYVTVNDTSINGCYCNCYYTMHMEITGLVKDKYFFYCDYPGMYPYMDSVKYRETLFRGK